MYRKIFYEMMPRLTRQDREMFNHDDYACAVLFQTRTGAPVAISRSRKLDIWEVRYGCSCIMFGTYDEALDFCRSRFHVDFGADNYIF